MIEEVGWVHMPGISMYCCSVLGTLHMMVWLAVQVDMNFHYDILRELLVEHPEVGDMG